jgi:hypothetical protein
MPTGIEQFKAMERFRLCYLKHRGNVLSTCEELGWPIEVGRSYANKVKGRVERDVAFGVSQSIMMQLLIGYESRVGHLQELLNRLDGTNKLIVSKCCYYPIFLKKERREPLPHCTNCNKKCETKIVGLPVVYDLIFRTVGQLQDEDRAIVEFAKKMGYVNPDAPPTSIVRNNVLVVDGNRKQLPLDQGFVQDVERLPPMEREKLRKRLEEHIKGGEGNG